MITILTERRAYRFDDADDWARDDSGDVHVFDGQESLATFDSAAFVATLNALDADAQRTLADAHETENL